MAIKIKTISSTGNFQKETGDSYVFSIDDKTKKAKTGVNVINILGSGYWNIILVIENGEWVSKKILKQNLTQSHAFKFAKHYVRTH